MTPEEKARKEIDQQLGQCGWHVQDHAAMNLSAGLGIAVREFPLNTGFADYLLYVDGKAAGVIEAKPEGHTLTGVETQSAKYNEGLPSEVPHYRLPWVSCGSGHYCQNEDGSSCALGRPSERRAQRPEHPAK